MQWDTYQLLCYDTCMRTILLDLKHKVNKYWHCVVLFLQSSLHAPKLLHLVFVSFWGMLDKRQKNQALLSEPPSSDCIIHVHIWKIWLCFVLQEVCSQIYATLYDYPVLKDCQGLRSYVAACVQVAWGLSVQNPPFLIMYDARQFHPDLHVRFHTSDPESVTIKNFLWPALTEGYNGPCVYKGVVITWHPSSFSQLPIHRFFRQQR